MATLTIRNLPEKVVERVKEAATRNGRSMEQEIRLMLEERYLSRNEVFERIRSRWAGLPAVSAEEIASWRDEERP